MSDGADKTHKETGSKTDRNAALPNAAVQDLGNPGMASVSGLMQPARRMNRAALTPNQIVQLQRTVGNKALSQLFRKDEPPQDHDSTLAMPQQADIADADLDSLQREALLQRDVSDEDRQWATDAKVSIESIQDAVTAATRRLNTDARTAIGHIRNAQEQYNNFETLYNAAVVRFVGGVEAARAREQEFRENVKFVATTIFVAAAPTAGAMYKAMDDALTKVQRVSSIMVMATTPAPAPDRSGGTSPAMAARNGGRIEWSELLSATLTAFETTLQNNESLTNMSAECITVLRFLDSVQNGRYTGNAPQSSESGTKASTMHSSLANIIRDLGAIDEGTVSGPTATLKDQITERLSTVTGRKLEQDLAIRWMGGLGPNELDEIDLADAYLARIGVFDSGDNRLDYDTGAITTSDDERILRWRAGWETAAMNLVGSTVTWLGDPMTRPGVIEDERGCREVKTYGGTVRDDRNGEWNVSVPRGVTPTGGGNMLITGYTMDRMDSSGWEWSRPGNLQQMLKWEVRLIGQPSGPMGGGAPRPGPVMHAAP